MLKSINTAPKAELDGSGVPELDSADPYDRTSRRVDRNDWPGDATRR